MSADTTWDDKLRYWSAIAVFGCAFLFLFATMLRTINEYDEGFILSGSTRVLSGEVPYRDFYRPYGPAQFYVLAALFKVFGPSVLVERIWDLLIRACTVLVIYLIVGRSWDRKRAIFLAVVTCIWLSYFSFYGYPVFPCLLFTLLSVYCLIPIYQGSSAIAPLLGSGISVGVTTLFRHDVGIASAVGGAFTLAMFHLSQKLDAPNKIRPLLRSVTIYTGGFAIPLALPLGLLLAAGAAHDMLLDLVVIPARTYFQMSSLPFPSVVATAREVAHLRPASLDQLAVYLPMVAVSLGAFATLKFSNQRSATRVADRALSSQRLWILVQLTVLCLLFFFKGWVRVSPIQMALAIIPSMIIITVWRIELRSTVTNVFFVLGIACLLAISLPAVLNAKARFANNLVWAEDSVFHLTEPENGTCFPPAGLDRIRCFYIHQEQLAAIRYIQEHTAENEAIFVGLNRHDKIFVNDVLFYFASKRPSVTKWDLFVPGVQTAVEIQSDIVAELQASHPRYVILCSRWEEVEEPNGSARSSGVTVLDKYIRTTYHEVATFGSLTILAH